MDKFTHPTKFTGEWPNWNGYTWLGWSAENKTHHPGEDYNFGYGSDDLGQDVGSTADGIVLHTSKSNVGYGNLVIIKHSIGYNLRQFIKNTYGIETDSLLSLYAHLKDVLVSAGNEVKSGDLIGHVGKTGTKSPHLHFEIFSLWKDLKNTTYRFYPVGWSKEKIKENWLPAYLFIEATKNLGSYDTFLGKTKEYWETVEKDRVDLMDQLSNKDKEWLKIKVEWDKEMEELRKQNQQLNDETAKADGILNTEKDRAKKEVSKLNDKIAKKDTDILQLKDNMAILISEQSEDYKIAQAFRLLIATIAKGFKHGEDKKVS